MDRLVFERPVDNRKYWLAMAVTIVLAIAFLGAGSSGNFWIAYHMAAFQIVGAVALLIRRPSSFVIVEADTISWCEDGLFWPSSSVVSFLEIQSVALKHQGGRQTIVLANRFSKPWVISDNCFLDGHGVIDAIRVNRPGLTVLADNSEQTETPSQ